MDESEKTAFAPGRVNLIGEHTDHQSGLALPFAIGLGITVTAAPAARIEAPRAAEPFVRGVVEELGLRGARVRIESDLPAGAGLASSAALTIALARALGTEPEPELVQRVEHRVGAQTGLLDPLAILRAVPGHALRIDFTTGETRPVPLDLRGWTLAVAGAGPRVNAESGYNARRAECDDGHPRRLRHVASENARVDAAVDALACGDLPTLAELLNASHASLRDDFEVSTPAVEGTVERLMRAGAAGARIHGGGFGGSVLALFPPGVAVPASERPVGP